MLTDFISEHNSHIIEKAIRTKSNGDNRLYENLLYEYIGIISIRKYKLSDILLNIKSLHINDNNTFDVHNLIIFDTIKEDEKTNINKMVAPSQITDGIHKCKKCSKRKISIYSMQTRSCDEPMTNFYTCVSCGCKWKD